MTTLQVILWSAQQNFSIFWYAYGLLVMVLAVEIPMVAVVARISGISYKRAYNSYCFAILTAYILSL